MEEKTSENKSELKTREPFNELNEILERQVLIKCTGQKERL